MPLPAPPIRFPKPSVSPEQCDARVREAVHGAIVGGAQPPDFAQLATALELRREEVCASFQRLASAGTITLWPDTHSIRLAPPFAAGYGDVRVSSAVGAGARGWWAAGLWNALGIPAALAGIGLALPQVVLRARDPLDGGPVCLQLVGPTVFHEPDEPEPVAILTRPFAYWWNDPTASITAIQLLRSPASPGASTGTVVPLQPLWALAQSWFVDRLHPDWRARSASEAQALVDGVGLRGDDWRIVG